MDDTTEDSTTLPPPKLRPVQRRQRLLGIPVDLLVVGALCLLIGAIVGRGLARRRILADLIGGKIAHVGQVKGLLSEQQRQIVHDVIDSGAQVLQQKIGNTVMLLVRAGGDSFQRLFIVPGLEGDETLADYDKRISQQEANGTVLEAV